MLAANTILQDRYRIVRLLGKGGMGAVYEAIDQRVSCVVALKEYLVGQQSEARQAFQREAALLANLRHSALPKVMDYFDDPRGDFLVMEYIPGHDLAALLASRDAPFRQEQVVRWAIELLRVLEYLHTRDPPILHRDIKPANLKVTKEDEVFLLDFGLAKGAAGQMATIETGKSVPGYTPVYAPLEQILGQGTDPRSDLYSLGATLYHLLTGQAPVSAPVRFDAIENDRPDPLPLANRINSQVTSDIATLVQSAMALSRKDRPASAAGMRMLLEKAEQAAAERDTARLAEVALMETLPAVPEYDPAKPLVADNDVQFTVYTPLKIKPEKNYSVLAFAHLSKRRADAPDDEPDPIKEMQDQAARVLGDQRDNYRDAKDSSSQPVPRGGDITFVPVVPGINFSPSIRSFTWRKSVHREEFDMWASREVDGQTLKGRMTVFLGSIIIAEVGLTISVDSHATSSAERISLEKAQSARRVRQMFASYSPKDEKLVAELAHVAPIFGSRFVIDRTHLEPGEDRAEGLQRLIRDADVFQLFWSTNSMRLPETVDEIKYAASLGRPGFILPTYWEDPLPRSPSEGLPPPEIEHLQFYRIYPGAISKAVSTKAESRLVIMGPTGAEIFIDDERNGSIGSSGRVILKSIPPGQHILRLTRAGQKDDERVIEIDAEAPEQIIQAKFRAAPIMPSAFAVGSATVSSANVSNAKDDVVCPRCGSSLAAGRFCGRCGYVASPQAPLSTTTFQKEPVSTAAEVSMSTMKSEAMAPVPIVPAQTQSYQAPVVAKRRKGMMMPIFAGAAMVLLVAILAPVWFMMSRSSSTPNLTTAPTKNSNTITSSNASSNSNPVSSRPQSFTNSAGIAFVYIPAGTFMMGSENGGDDEKPVHSVTISKGFYMAKYEVTQAQWQSLMGNNPSSKKGDNLPVDQVSWNDAIEFIGRLNARDTGYTYRLPTEAEWEYAARAGTNATYDWGDDVTQACRYANVVDLTTKARYPQWSVINCRDGYFDPSPVGSFQPNSFGLYDMTGNVWEWCQDWFGGNYYKSSASADPQGPSSGTARVERGGSCIDVESFYRAAARSFATPEQASSRYGFRLVAVARTQ